MNRGLLAAVALVAAGLVQAEIRGTQADLLLPPLDTPSVRAMELALSLNPADLEVRSRLILHYLVVGSPRQQGDHALWLVEHHPEAPILSLLLFFENEGPLQNVDAFRRANELWLRHLETSDSPAVIDHAVQFLSVGRNPVEQERLYLLAMARGTKREGWTGRLAGLYEQHIINTERDPAFAARAAAAVATSNDGLLLAEMATLARLQVQFQLSRQGKTNEELTRLANDWEARARALGYEPRAIPPNPTRQ